MAATTANTRPTTAGVARALASKPAEPKPAPRRPSHAARRVATAVRGIDGRLMLLCPA